MRVALLSHRSGNIGHAFMARGWEHIVREAFGDRTDIVHYEQHDPLAVHGRRTAARLLTRARGQAGQRARTLVAFSPTWRRRLLGRAPLPRDVGVAISCGGPNIVPDVGTSPEMELMFPYLHGIFKAGGAAVVDAAVGSAFPLEALPTKLDDASDTAYYARLFAVTDLSTVRDRLARDLWADLGRTAPLIACGSVAMGRDARPHDREGAILVNYQAAGANTDWGQGVDREAWATTVGALVTRLAGRHKVTMLCHNRQEVALARRVAPGVPYVLPATVAEFVALAESAQAAVTNRLHAALGLAGCGVPAVVVGTDSRLGAAAQMGLRTRYVKEVAVDGLEADIEALVSARRDERDRLISLREQTIETYVSLLRSCHAEHADR